MRETFLHGTGPVTENRGMVTFARLDADRHDADLIRIWEEIGWIDRDDDSDSAAVRTFYGVGSTTVAEIDGAAECAVHRSTGSLRHAGGFGPATDLPLCAVTAVATSHVARRRGLATALTADALGAAAAEGAAVAALGIFEQGYYDRLGFGSGAYTHRLTFDPATLTVPVPTAPPVRVGRGEHAEIHDLLHRRSRGHGSVVLDPAPLTEAELAWWTNPIGLGFRGDDGRLTHAFVGEAHGEHGPLRVQLLLAEEPGQLVELFGLLRALSDQFRQVEIPEPAGVQVQDLVGEPARQANIVRMAGRAGGLQSTGAWQQWRILDLAACVDAVRWPGEPVACNLSLTDPLATLERSGASGSGSNRSTGEWTGVGGEYRLRLGETSSIEVGTDPALPTLTASVGAFTRAWLGVRPASGLALTDDLSGPPDLLAALDVALRTPVPVSGWDF